LFFRDWTPIAREHQLGASWHAAGDGSPGGLVPQEVPTEGELRSWFAKYSNWGAWGADDRLGALNHITGEKRSAAVRSVEHGTSVSCAWDIPMNTVTGDGRQPARRFMTQTGLGYSSSEALPPGEPRSPDGSMAVAAETVSMSFHGRAITHLDALSHIFWEGQMYGGVPASHVTDRDGALTHDVRAARDGVYTRGVLLDIPRAKSRQFLDPGEPIFPDDLEAAEASQGVQVGPGDALLVRTGEGVRRLQGNWQPGVVGSPGLHAACIPWLHARRVAILGADVPQEVTPSGYQTMALPLHALAIVALGLWLVDNCQLEDLADACQRFDRWHFFFALNPLRMEGVTGSPVNPTALF
jgi:kynurenine formamidase